MAAFNRPVTNMTNENIKIKKYEEEMDSKNSSFFLLKLFTNKEI